MLCTQEKNASCRQVLLAACDPENEDEHVASDVLDHLDWGDWSVATVSTWLLMQKVLFMFSVPIHPCMYCHRHGRYCHFARCDVDMSGTPCVDFSPAGLQRGVEGESFPVLLSFLAFHRSQKTKIILMENVPEFPALTLLQCLMGDMYDVQEFFMEPADIGASHMSRMRVFAVMTLRGRVVSANQVLQDDLMILGLTKTPVLLRSCNLGL